MWRDLVHGWRAIRAMPVVATVIVLSLGVGIGVNTAVFSWVQVFVLQPLPGVVGASEFHLVEPRVDSGAYPGASWPEYQDLRSRVTSVPDLVAFRMVALNVGEATGAQRTFALLASGNYFSALGLRAVLGRLLTPEDAARAGGVPVVVVSHAFWRSRLAGDPGAIGRSVRANGVDLTVVGVVPDRFQGTVLGLQFDLWVPATMAPVLLGGSRELDERTARGYTVMGRLPAGTSVQTARQDVDRAMQELALAHPDSNRGLVAEVLPYWRAPRGPQRMFLQALVVLQALMVLLLVAVCGNTATLMLARAAARQREMTVRLAMGAGRWRIVRLILAESVVLGLLGAVAGVALAAWGTEVLRTVPLTTALPIRFQTHVDLAGLAVATLLGVCSAAFLGLMPALQMATVEMPIAVRAGARGPASRRLRSLAMGAQVALAMAVLIVAGLFLRSFADTQETHPGFERDGVLLAAFDRSARGGDAEDSRLFAGRVLERLRQLPGVEEAAIAASVPLDIHGLPLRPFSLEGLVSTGGVPERALSNTVTPGYFRAMGIPRVAGDDLAPLSDTVLLPQVVVNEAFVDRFLPGATVLGRRLTQGDRTYVIAGVVRTSLSESFGEAPAPCMYFSYRDRPSRAGEMHLRTRPGAEGALAGLVRAALGELDPATPVFNVRTLADHVENNLFLRRIPARLFMGLGPLLLALAAIGIYAVVAFAVASRTADIGVRLALGATARRVVGEVVAHSLSVIGVGAAAGWLCVWIVYARFFGLPTDALSFALVPALLLVVAGVSCWLPARRAAGIDPAIALKRD